LLLFDTTNYDSFDHVNEWLQEAKKQIEPNNAIFMLVGTKVDKDNQREGTLLTVVYYLIADLINIM
jgi:GTPase SAR1 family protein